MSAISLLDTLTGGSASKANEDLEKAQQLFANIPTPTAADLTLPQLQQYVEAGIMTPAQAQTALQSSNAYNNISLNPSDVEAEKKSLGELDQVATDKGMTPQMQAQLTAALDQSHTDENGANASILDQMAQRGIPTSLMGTAAQLANNGREADNANLTATTAAGQAEANAINAMMNEGNLAGSMQGQQESAAENKAAAANAMQQWNAGATNSTNAANADRAQAANAYNATNKQTVANNNTGTVNQRTEYNAQVPETVFNNAITKASGQAGIYGQQANQATNQGNQIMGLIGGAIGSAATAAGAPPVGAAKPPTGYNPNISEDMLPGGYTGGIAMQEGGHVPGEAKVSGDSPKNDSVHAMLSPGEIVVPRSIAPHPEAVKRFVQHLTHGKPPPRPVHPQDVHSILEALSMRRGA